MSAEIMIFDTHLAVESLIGTGIKKEQAEAFVRIIKDNKDNDLGRLASKEQLISLEKDVEIVKQNSVTKTDLLETEKRLDDKIQQVRMEFKNDLHSSERRLMLMIGGSMATTCGIIISTLKYLLQV